MTEIIHVLNRRVQLHQPEGGLRTSTDTVLLAAACPVKPGQSLLDMGCGTGGAGLCVARRVEKIALSGIDIQSGHIELARENARLNAQEADFTAGDIRMYEGGPFDHIICNPPYYEAGAHTRPSSGEKAAAIGHENASLQDWLDAANRLLRQRGTLTLIHRADCLQPLVQGLKTRFGALEIVPVYAKADRPAGRMILRAVRNAKGASTLHPGLILHRDDGAYSQEAENILREMRPIL